MILLCGSLVSASVKLIEVVNIEAKKYFCLSRNRIVKV